MKNSVKEECDSRLMRNQEYIELMIQADSTFSNLINSSNDEESCYSYEEVVLKMGEVIAEEYYNFGKNAS